MSLMQADRIRSILPHRYPMLLLDSVEEVVPGVRLSARKAITANEPWYENLDSSAEHAYPAVLLVESWGQAAGILAASGHPNEDLAEGSVMLFGGVSDVRFHQAVLPGTVLEHEVRLTRSLEDTMIFEGESLVGGRVVLEVGRALMAMRPADQLPARESLSESESESGFEPIQRPVDRSAS